MHTYIQVIYDIDTCLITVSFRCHVVYWSIVIIRHGFSGAPLSLQPFLDDVPLFHDISEEFPPIKGTFHPTKLSRLSIYIYSSGTSIIFCQKTGIFRLNSWEFSRGSPDCPQDEFRSLSAHQKPGAVQPSWFFRCEKGGRNAEKFMNSWDISWGNA